MLITDLTRGSSRKMLWMFSIPMLLSVAFQQVYQIADSIIAGQFIGEAALAAVGASHPITMIFMAVAVGSNIGCAVVVSRLFGAKKYSALKTAICTIFCACLAVSVVLTLVGIFGGSAMFSPMPNSICISISMGFCSCIFIISATASSPLWGTAVRRCISSSAPP